MFIWTYLHCNRRYLDNSLRVILQTLSQMLRTPFSLRSVYCGPGNIQCIYSSSYSGFNIKLNLPALLLETCHHLDARYALNFVSYIAHTLQFTLCELLSRTYTMKLQHGIFRHQCSTQCICAAIGDISTIQCSLYCTTWCQIQRTSTSLRYVNCGPQIYNPITVPHILASIFKWTYLSCYWRYLVNSMRVTLQIWSQT
jgi:hypothetical protein